MEARLANLLGIDIVDDDDHHRNYVSEILTSLLDVYDGGNDPDDVAEYLGGFVSASSSHDGDDEPKLLRQFSIDVARLRLEDGNDDDDEAGAVSSSPAARGGTKPRILDEGAAQREAIKRREMEARERQKKEREDQLRRKKEVENDDEERLRREKKWKIWKPCTRLNGKEAWGTEKLRSQETAFGFLNYTDWFLTVLRRSHESTAST